MACAFCPLEQAFNPISTPLKELVTPIKSMPLLHQCACLAKLVVIVAPSTPSWVDS